MCFFRCSSLLALSAFLAFAASTSELQTLILSSCSSGMDHAVQEAWAHWCSSNNTSCPEDECSACQRSWDSPGVARDWVTIWNNYVNDVDRARLLAPKATRSSDWIFALSISSCGLCMCDETIRVAVGLRLWISLCEAHTCLCRTTASAREIHGVSCKMSTGGSTRHYQINDLIWSQTVRCSCHKRISSIA